MDIALISGVAFLASVLTFFSGFGLGTLLLPVFALYFPIHIAILLTAIVHLLNNVFKFFIVAKKANLSIILKFGLSSIVAAFIGAKFLEFLIFDSSIISYQIFNSKLNTSALKIAISMLMIGFALFEIIPRLQNLSFKAKYLYLGGLLSGFFGGLSGHQGALRSAFLIRLKLEKEALLATNIIIAILVDLSRLSTYKNSFTMDFIYSNNTVLLVAIFSAFAGALLGNYYLKKVTVHSLQSLTALGIIIFSLFLGFGII